MSGCTRFGSELAAFADSELSDDVRAELEAHLAGCEPCRLALEDQRWLDGRLAQLEYVEPGPQFEARFWARLAREEETRERRAGWRRWRFWTAASVAAAAVGAVALAVVLDLGAPGGAPPLEEPDFPLLADAELFEIAAADDLELLDSLDVLEAWDAVEEI